MRPSVLLLDEPLSNLDSALRIRMRNEIRTILKEVHITSIFVTHDQREAFSICDRIVLMNKGKVVQIGTPEALYETPTNLTAASLLGEANVIALKDQPVTGASTGFATAQTVSGVAITGIAPAATTSGAVLQAMVRPEHFSINSPSAGPNAWPGRVIARTYEGTGIDLVIRALDQDLSIKVGVEHDAAEGTEVTVSVPPERLLFLS